MNNTNFWGTDVDSIEKMATSLNDNDEMISSLFKRHTKDSIYPLYYKEPLVETDCKITDIASEIYEKLGVYDHCFVSACSKIVVGLSILEPNQEDLCDQFFMVATTDQEYMGFYMDGNFVFEVPKSSVVITPHMLNKLGDDQPHLNSFCEEITDAANKLVTSLIKAEIKLP